MIIGDTPIAAKMMGKKGSASKLYFEKGPRLPANDIQSMMP